MPVPTVISHRARPRLHGVLLPLALLATSLPLFASEEAKLEDPSGAVDDRYGSAVAIDGATAVVGAPRHSQGGIGSGAAYVYVSSGGTWSLQQKLAPSDPASGQWFGGAVALDGDTIVVGARHDPEKGFNAGAAYVFTRSGTVWTQQQKLLGTNTADFDWFGHAVALDGERALVGAHFKNVVGFGSGAAYVFVRSGTVWTQEDQLAPNDPGGNDFFGWAVSLSGDRAAVGAKFEDGGASDGGAAYVFLRSGANWNQEAKLLASDAGVDDQLGSSIGLDGDVLVTGSILDDDQGADAGAAYVFARTAGGWLQDQKLAASDGVAGDLFGNDVAVSGATLVVGAFHADDLGTHAGAAYVYGESGGAWSELEKLVGSDSAVDDWFGTSVSIDAERALVGAQEHADRGAAYVFLQGTPFDAYCFGDGSGTPCPCGNASAPGAGEGCANATGSGAELGADGSNDVGDDDLTFAAANLLPGQPALLFAGENAVNGGDGLPFGDGLRCAGANVVRLGVKTPNGSGQAAWGPGLGANGGWSAGDTRFFQAWYRNPTGSPCGALFNLTNGVQVDFAD